MSATRRAVSLELRQLALPMRLTIRHAAAERKVAHPLIVTVTLDDGSKGYGEVIPRRYLTGESLDSCAADIAGDFWPRVRELGFRADRHPSELLGGLQAAADGAQKTAAWAGLDVALHDAWARAFGIPGARLFGQAGEARGHTAVVTTGMPAGLATMLYRRLGFRDFKVKVGDPGEIRRVSTVRRLLGDCANIRIDANGAWRTVDEARSAVGRLHDQGLVLVEQPLPRGDAAALAACERALGLPVMADESLCNLADARALQSAGGVGFWNIRLAKVGGFTGARALLALAVSQGVRWQLGALVGETALTAAATRAALGLGVPAYVETSFPRLLLRDDPFRQAEPRCEPMVRPLGEAPGLGVTPDPSVLARRTEWVRLFS